MTNSPTSHAENFYKNSTFTKIKLENGKESSITVLFNNSEISFEEINRFLRNAITQTPQIKTHQTTFGTLKDGNFKPSAIFNTNTNEKSISSQLIETYKQLIECMKKEKEENSLKIANLEYELKEYKRLKALSETQKFRFN